MEHIIKLAIILFVISFIGCCEDDLFEDQIEDDLHGMVMELDGELVFKSRDYVFNLDNNTLEGGRGNKLKMYLFTDRLSSPFGQREFNEVFFETRINSTGYRDSTFGRVLFLDLNDGSTAGQIKTPLYNDSGQLLGNANIQWRNCEVVQDTFNAGFSCANIDNERFCFGITEYEKDAYQNHRWTFRNSNLDYITLMLPNDGLSVGTYAFDSLFQSNQSLNKPIIRYRRRRSAVPFFVDQGTIEIISNQPENIEAKVNVTLKTSQGSLRIEDMDIKVRIRP